MKLNLKHNERTTLFGTNTIGHKLSRIFLFEEVYRSRFISVYPYWQTDVI